MKIYNKLYDKFNLLTVLEVIAYKYDHQSRYDKTVAFMVKSATILKFYHLAPRRNYS